MGRASRHKAHDRFMIKQGIRPEWGPWHDVTSQDTISQGKVSLGWRCLENAVYQVHVTDAGVLEGLGTLTHLSIKRLDKAAVHDWRDLQEIKTTILGEDVEGLSIFPAESRLVDTSNQYHIWCLPEGVKVPFGFHEGRMVLDGDGVLRKGRARQRPLPPTWEASMTPEEVAEKVAEMTGIDDGVGRT